MKTKLAAAIILILFILAGIQVQAEEQTRKVESFSSISLRIGASVHLEQGEKQNLEIVAKSSTLEEIITEVKDGELIIRFPNKNFFWSSFKPGEITIYITTPEISGLVVSGSGDNYMMLAYVSGSGNDALMKLSQSETEKIVIKKLAKGTKYYNGKYSTEYRYDLFGNVYTVNVKQTAVLKSDALVVSNKAGSSSTVYLYDISSNEFVQTDLTK